MIKRQLLKIYFSYVLLLFPLAIPWGGGTTVDGMVAPQATPKNLPPIAIQAPPEQVPAKLVSIAPPAPKPTTNAPTVVPDCGDNTYANYIYMHESGCNTSAVNANGCRGIGQACPGSKLPCGADYACQNAWFTNYAIDRYGSWANAYNFWLSHRWW